MTVTLARHYPRVELNRFASRHHGLLTRQVALRAGLTDSAIYRRVRSGHWDQVHAGVYRAVAAPPTWEQALYAAVLNAGPSGVGSHTSAARLWGLSSLWSPNDDIETTTQRLRQPRTTGVVSHRSLHLFESDCARRQHIPVTTVARTLVDLSSRASMAHLGQALDQALDERLVTLRALQSCIDRLPPAPGRKVKLVQRLIVMRRPRSDETQSKLEDRMMRVIARAALPLPRQQYVVRVGARRYVIDAAWPTVKVAAEADGFKTHKTRVAFDYDRDRRNDLESEGWQVVNFTSNTDEDRYARQLRRLLAARGLGIAETA